MIIKEHYSKGFRFYLIDGIPYVSNTSVLKLLNKERITEYNIRKTIAFIVKRGNLSNETISLAYNFWKLDLQDLADKGIDKHKLAADYMVKNKYIKDNWLDIFIAWKEKEQFTTIPSLVEKFVYNKKYRIAGRIDLLGKIFNEPIGIDIKTSSGIFNTHKIQCCGYDLMLKNSIKWAVLDIPRDKPENKKFHILTPEEQMAYRNVFLCLNSAFQELWKNGDLKVDIKYE